MDGLDKRTLSKRIFLGIDPGVTGAWAMLDQDAEILEIGYYSQRTEIELANVDLAVMEKQSSRPFQSAPSTFILGENYGIWQGHLESYSIPFEFVTPKRWQKSILDFIPVPVSKPPGETPEAGRKRLAKNRAKLKAAIADYVLRKYPDLQVFLMKKKNWDMADAVCICLYAIKRWNETHIKGETL